MKYYARRNALEIPNVGHGRSQLYMTHSFAADLSARDFHAALVADDALVSYPLVFTAMALPVLGGSENALAEQTVLFRLLRAVVYGFGFGDFAMRPRPYLVGGSHSDLYAVKIVYFGHNLPPYSSSSPSVNRLSRPLTPSSKPPSSPGRESSEPNRLPSISLNSPKSNSSPSCIGS